MEQRTGVRPDLASGETHRNVFFPTLYYFLFEDPLFQEWLLHPVLLALVTYLLGESCVLTTTAVFMKGPADESERGLQLGLHSDQQMVPQPFPPYALICGATLLLTDYSKDDGAFAYVPGSHQQGRHPGGSEATSAAIPVVAPKGSLVVHHGALWHGSFPRTRAGTPRRHGVRVHPCVHDAARGVSRARHEGTVRSAPAALRHADEPGCSCRQYRVGP